MHELSGLEFLYQNKDKQEEPTKMGQQILITSWDNQSELPFRFTSYILIWIPEQTDLLRCSEVWHQAAVR